MCYIEDCNEISFCREMCVKHYSRWYRYGDPTTLKIKSSKDAKNWLSRRLEEPWPVDECVFWPFVLNDAGYGLIGRKRVTHLILEAFEVNCPEGCSIVMHQCDVPKCINLNHLSWGTQAENVRDCVNKGRFDTGGLQKQDWSMTVEQVREAKELLSQGVPKSKLARNYGISRNALYNNLKRDVGVVAK